MYKTRYDWVRKVIHWEMCKKFKFDHIMFSMYKTRHDWVRKVIHWEMCKKFKFDQQKMINKKKENSQNCRLWCPG